MNPKTLALFASFALLAACSDSGGAPDSGLVILDVPVVDRSVANDTTAPDVTTADVTTADAAPDVTVDASADAATDASRGMYVDGCFVGTPVEMTDFLNRCTTATALPARAPRGTRLAADGGVQPLPM